MNFRNAPDHVPNQIFSRKLSENGIWEIGVHPVIYGYRIRAGIVGSTSVAVDYCAADDASFLGQLYAIVQGILEIFPETTTEMEMRQALPTFRRKPINQDPCWDNLKKLLAERISK